jgi:ATP-dependent RNA/DNA helicase IGHMBP2
MENFHSISYSNAEEEVTQLLKAFQDEAKTERDAYLNKLSDKSIADRIKQGITIYPLEISDIQYFVGDSWKIILNIKKNLPMNCELNEGSPISIFRGDESKFGVLSRISESTLTVIIDGDTPDWMEEGQVGIDLFYSEKSYKEGERALNRLLENEKEIKNKRDLYLGYKKIQPEFSKLRSNSLSAKFNPSQKLAIERIITTQDCLVVQGPPGTGKTSVLAEAIRILVKDGNRVLLSTPTNSALDLLLRKCIEQELQPVRLGQITKVSDDLIPFTLDGLIDSHFLSKQIQKYKREMENLRKKANKYHRNFNSKLAEERKETWKEFNGIREIIKNTERQIEKEILRLYNPILATNVSASNKILNKERFDICIIDEAIQSLEPLAWIPILKSDRIVLAGDENQLPPTILSGNKMLMNTLFSKMVKNFQGTERLVFLNTQYRMEEEILGFSNQEFYNNRISSDSSIKDRPKIYKPLFTSSLVFIDTAGAGYEEAQSFQSESYKNHGEAGLISIVLKEIINQLSISANDIGIIAPYREQIMELKDALKDFPTELEISTVDSFQGREKDVIFLSMTRSNENNEVGFLKDYRRMNVSLTRARKLLIVVGDSSTLVSDNFYNRFIKYCQDNCDYRSAYEFMVV